MTGDIMYILTFLNILTGLSLFLYGLKAIRIGVQSFASESLKKLIEKLTQNPVIGIIIGSLITVLLQSSSTTVTMAVGFVNAGVMTLKQAIGIIMGANIGTTITAQLVAFKLTYITPFLLIIGISINFFAKRRIYKQIDEILIGFGFLFFGMQIMSNAFMAFKGNPSFENLMTSLSNHPMYGILLGIIMTILIQNSSATIGLLQAMAMQHLINLNIALPVLIGDNIGTTFSVFVASMQTNHNAKRAALYHFMFNFIGAIVFILLIKPFSNIVMSTSHDIARQIANAHTLFNTVNTIIQLPFINFLVILITKIIPSKNPEIEKGFKYIDERIAATPLIALGQVEKEILRMAKLSVDTLRLAFRVYFDQKLEYISVIKENEEYVDSLDKGIAKFLAKISSNVIAPEQVSNINTYFNYLNEFERICDHAEKIAEMADYITLNKVSFSQNAIKDLNYLKSITMTLLEETMKALEKKDSSSMFKILNEYEEAKKAQNTIRSNHIKRLSIGDCLPESSMIFLDLVSHMARIQEHTQRIAEVFLGR